MRATMLFLRARRWPMALLMLLMVSAVTLLPSTGIAIPLIDYQLRTATLWPMLAALPTLLVFESVMASWERLSERHMVLLHAGQMLMFLLLALLLVSLAPIVQRANLQIVYCFIVGCSLAAAALSPLPGWMWAGVLGVLLLYQQWITDWLEGAPAQTWVVVLAVLAVAVLDVAGSLAWARRVETEDDV